jgi:hypothetical protein
VSRTVLEDFVHRHHIRVEDLARRSLLSPSIIWKLMSGAQRGKPRTWAALLPVLQEHTALILTPDDFLEPSVQEMENVA